jgi:dihydrofolate reductase
VAKIVLSEFLTLDGVMQAPGDADEDRRDGFDKGGWQQARPDGRVGEYVIDGLVGAGGLLLGRRTYDLFAAYWPNQPTDNPFAAPINSLPKFVVSRTLSEPLSWQNSTLISTDIPNRLRQLKSEVDKDILVIGSGNLAQTLMANDLVDEYRLMVYPVVLGKGHRLFRDADITKQLRLTESITTSTGVLLLKFIPESAS